MTDKCKGKEPEREEVEESEEEFERGKVVQGENEEELESEESRVG